MRVKGLAFRAYVSWLQREKKTEAVLARVPPSTAALLREPPLPGSWIDGMDMVRIVSAIEMVAGLDAVRRCGRETIEDILPKHHTLVTGLLRLFGATPATLFRRVNDLMRTSAEGIHYTYTPTGERSGLMEVRYDVPGELPMCAFLNGMTLFMVLFALAGVNNGVIGDPQRRGPAIVAYQLQW
jgi:hypothetical protein